MKQSLLRLHRLINSEHFQNFLVHLAFFLVHFRYQHLKLIQLLQRSRGAQIYLSKHPLMSFSFFQQQNIEIATNSTLNHRSSRFFVVCDHDFPKYGINRRKKTEQCVADIFYYDNNKLLIALARMNNHRAFIFFFMISLQLLSCPTSNSFTFRM